CGGFGDRRAGHRSGPSPRAAGVRDSSCASTIPLARPTGSTSPATGRGSTSRWRTARATSGWPRWRAA
ncbi:MAG: hypothetical protein AVDCRST_MAG11-150, partial [uncultured Gemmatimonadaceae bacterium]